MLRKTLVGTTTLLALLALAPTGIATTAEAQTIDSASKAGIVTVQARVQSVDPANRLVTLVGPEGRQITVQAGDEVRNFAQIKPGDIVTARYYRSVGYVLSGPNAQLPSPGVAVEGARAPEGAKPAGVVARHVTLTGVVTGVDVQKNEISLVEPTGGAVQTIHVMDPRYQARLGEVHAGQKLTILLTEALAISLSPDTRH